MTDDLYFQHDVPPDREPEQATALALLRAYGQGDREAVQAIVNSTDQPRLLAVMTGLAGLLAEALYAPGRVDAALQGWLATGEMPPPYYVD
jgi:hypothetical protein